MERKYLMRYLILIGILIVCAGAAWYIRSSAESTRENAVLVWQKGRVGCNIGERMNLEWAAAV